MNGSLLLSALASTLAVVYAYNENPIVSSPKNMTYNSGMKVAVTWDKANTGFVNIDLINMYRNVLDTPYSIAQGVPAKDGKFEWEIPADLKTATGYQIRVWGSYQPKSADNFGNSALFTVFNDLPNAVNNFKVITPNKASPCHVGSPCKITWDYPTTINAPRDVDVVLYQVGNPVPLKKLATVSAADKAFTWDVPEDQQLLQKGNVFIAVDGSGIPHEVPKMASNMGANSDAFKMAAPIPAPQESAEDKAKCEAEEAGLKKKQEEEDEAEKKRQEQEEEEAEKKRQEEEELNKKNAQKENSASATKVTAAVAVVAAMVGLLPFF